MYKLVVQTHIDAAHCLPAYEGKCSQMHGHRWEIVVSYVFPELMGTVGRGMLVDFAWIKAAIRQFDHSDLNDLIPNPTAENLAYDIWTRLPGCPGLSYDLTVEVWETPDSMVSYTEWREAIEETKKPEPMEVPF